MNFEAIILFFCVAFFFLWLFVKDSKHKTFIHIEDEDGKVKREFREKRKAQDTLVLEKPENFEINDEIEEVLNMLEHTKENIFLTGKAGTGKSTLLRYFRVTTKKSPVVIAPTGVAAVNVQGQTIHNFFGWGINITPERVRKVSYEKSHIYRKVQMIVIDEISMVRADLFECIDRFLRLNTGKPDEPFGGVQIVAIGDLYQLPPVVKGDERRLFETKYDSPFFFSTEAFKKGRFKKYELGKVFRQKDAKFVAALNALREGECEQQHIDFLNTSVITDEPANFEDYVRLVTTNKMAKEINDHRMSLLPSKEVTYEGVLTGNFKEADMPTDQHLPLKVGAQVMLLNNDKNRRWVNGDVVKVVETKKDSLVVEFDDNSIEEVSRHTWETVRFIFDEEEKKVIPKKIGSFSQIPVKPSWAMTIHKAQGKTFDKMFIDLGAGAFAEGQTYVALSRCKTLEGMKLAAPLTSHDIFVNEKVRDFMQFRNEKDKVFVLNQKKERLERIDMNIKRAEEKRTVSKEDFVRHAIKNLRTGKYKGIHVVYSGFNQAFREYFNEDPIDFIKELEKRGAVTTRPVRGGVMLYDASEVSKETQTGGGRQNKALKKILEG